MASQVQFDVLAVPKNDLGGNTWPCTHSLGHLVEANEGWNLVAISGIQILKYDVGACQKEIDDGRFGLFLHHDSRGSQWMPSGSLPSQVPCVPVAGEGSAAVVQPSAAARRRLDCGLADGCFPRRVPRAR